MFSKKSIILLCLILCNSQTNGQDHKTESQNLFLLTIFGSNLTAVDLLKKLSIMLQGMKEHVSDLNECATFRDICGPNSTCENYVGSFQCVCQKGYSVSNQNESGVCYDINECETGDHNCNRGAKCSNLLGSYSCDCVEGFEGSGTECKDLDECQLDNVCEEFADCININGSYKCECKTGYQEDGDNKCKDIDECANNLCNYESEICLNNEGSYSCACAEGFYAYQEKCTKVIDHCAHGTHDCHTDAECKNEGFSYFCTCSQTTYDNSTDGRLCVSPVTVECTSSAITVIIVRQYYEERNIKLQQLHLQDYNCVGAISDESPHFWKFQIRDNLASCLSTVTKNDTHLTYANVLTNSVQKGIFSGFLISIPFSCSYPTNINVSLPAPFIPKANKISINGPDGLGEFVVEMNIFTDSMYTTVSNTSVYSTTDIIYVQVKLQAEKSDLFLILKDCWATPDLAEYSQDSYAFIEDGCQLPGRIGDTVKVTANSVGKTSHFQTQSFGFVDYNTTYLHCTVDLCLKDRTNSCSKTCPTISNNKLRFTSNQKRSLPSSNKDVLSLGPFAFEKETKKESKNVDNSPYFDKNNVVVMFFCGTLVMSIVGLAVISVLDRRHQTRVLEELATVSPRYSANTLQNNHADTESPSTTERVDTSM